MCEWWCECVSDGGVSVSGGGVSVRGGGVSVGGVSGGGVNV